MKPSTPIDELFSLAALTAAPDYGARILQILPSIGDADSAASAVAHFRRALRLIGADAGVFLSVIRDDATRTSYRSLVACDPLWAIEYVQCGWHEHDPWLRHAIHCAEPIRGTELEIRPDEEVFVRTSMRLGFASAVVAPAPSEAGMSRVGVLCLGSHTLGFFDGEGYQLVRVIARALAMELHRWLLRAIRSELLALSRVTPQEIELLRHEEAGHSSKMIGAELNIEAKTVDCRFQRLSAKLDAPDRRTAARIARLYGLL
ncbi:LuxR C-terminal-related transcriptional regulator [Roseateles sp. P5_E11]